MLRTREEVALDHAEILQEAMRNVCEQYGAAVCELIVEADSLIHKATVIVQKENEAVARLKAEAGDTEDNPAFIPFDGINDLVALGRTIKIHPVFKNYIRKVKE